MFAKNKFQKFIAMIFILATLLSSIQAPNKVSAQNQDGLKRQLNAETGKVSFIGPESGRALSASRALGTFLRPQDPAMALAKRYAPEFGIKDPEHDLTELKKSTLDNGRVSIRYQQKYQGIPVMGGELIVNTNGNGDLYSMSGEASPNLSVPTQPTIDSAQAIETALQAMAKYYQKTPADFVVSTPQLWIYDESLLKPSTRPAELVWRMEVTPKDNAMPMRELVLVNAERGNISLHFNQVDNAGAAPNLPQAQNLKTVSSIKSPEFNSGYKTTDSVIQKLPALVGSNTWYVATTGNDANDCATTSTPCATINGAIGKAANSGDMIKVAIGTYIGTGSYSVVTLTKSLIVSGGWNNTFIAQTGYSIVDGQNGRRGFISYGGINSSISNFIVENGNANPSDTGNGGGIYGLSGLTISNSIIRNNYASYDGGGVYGGIINNSIIEGNTAQGIGGGAVFSEINNSTIKNNTANLGGGIGTYGGGLTIRNSTIYKNTSNFDGGGVYIGPNSGTNL